MLRMEYLSQVRNGVLPKAILVMPPLQHATSLAWTALATYLHCIM